MMQADVLSPIASSFNSVLTESFLRNWPPFHHRYIVVVSLVGYSIIMGGRERERESICDVQRGKE